MSKKSVMERNKKRRKMAKTFGNRRDKLKAIVMDKNATVEERFEAQLKLAELPRNSSKVRVRNRCQLTGRPRGYYRKLKMCRNQLRELASHGQIPGMIKSSW